jgi:hypothetical protein
MSSIVPFGCGLAKLRSCYVGHRLARLDGRERAESLADLSRLKHKVKHVGQQLDRLEAKMRRLLEEVLRERLEAYR